MCQYLRHTVDIPANCFQIFKSIFGLLFCLLDRKLILGSKHIWQSLRKFPCAVWSVGTFSQIEKKKEMSLFHENCTLVCGPIFFWIITFLRDRKFKILSENLGTNFSEWKDIDFCSIQIYGDITTLWLLITLCNMPKGVVT